MSRARTPVLLVGLLAVLGAACDAALSIRVLDASAPADGGGESAECAACAQAHCGAASSTCTADTVFCAPYESCLAGCPMGDPACRSQCTIDHPAPATGSAAASALSACLAANCELECNLPCGAFAAYLSEPGSAAACQQCLDMYACSDSLACGSSIDCDAYWRCYAACPTPDCKFNCAQEHEAGVALFRPLQQDYSGSCAMACAFGNYWACAGHISWPAANSEQVALTVPVVDYIQRTPVPGETVAVCTECPCPTAVDPVLAMGTTDDGGTVTLTFDQMLNSSGVGINGCVQVTSATGATVPYFGYWGYPLTEPVVNPALGPGTLAANLAAQSAEVFTPDELDAAAGFLGENLIPGRGLVGASVFDCFDNPASGARVSIDTSDPLVSPFYGSGDAGTTTTLGLVFFFDVPPGRYIVTAMPGPLDGGPSSSVAVNVEQATTTAVGMFPTPIGPDFPTP